MTDSSVPLRTLGPYRRRLGPSRPRHWPDRIPSLRRCARDAGQAYPLARNDVSGNEFAGPTFTKDGQVLFACIQGDGYTFAITGPWK